MTLPVVLADVQSRFNPRKIPGLVLWYSADKISGLSDGDPIATWPDRSGNGIDATQATEAKRPLFKVNQINGRPAVRSDGSDDNMSLSPSVASGPKTFFSVIKPTVGSEVFLFDTNVGRLVVTPSGATFELGYYDGAWQSQGALSNVWQILVWKFKLGTGESYRNGSSMGTDSHSLKAIGSSTRIFSNNGGASAFLACDCAEFGIYDSDLSDPNLSKLNKYLGSKYAIAVA